MRSQKRLKNFNPVSKKSGEGHIDPDPPLAIVCFATRKRKATSYQSFRRCQSSCEGRSQLYVEGIQADRTPWSVAPPQFARGQFSMPEPNHPIPRRSRSASGNAATLCAMVQAPVGRTTHPEEPAYLGQNLMLPRRLNSIMQLELQNGILCRFRPSAAGHDRRLSSRSSMERFGSG
jgi:hypothetical protein